MPGGLVLRARHRPGAGDMPEIGAAYEASPLSQDTVAPFLAALGLRLGGEITLEPPFAPGLGCGVSTAALVALARLAGFAGPPEALARACVEAEGASDPLMFAAPNRMLFASREGRVLMQLASPPPVHLVAGFFGAPTRTDATDADYDDISDLVAQWQRRDDAGWCAALAAESALRCLARRGPADDPTPDLARDLGALGFAMSHSGAARALVFPADAPPRHGEEAMKEAGLVFAGSFAPQAEAA